MGIQINVTVNGNQYTNEVEPRTLLVDYLREELNLTGTHVGCDTSSCGACTIMVDSKAVKSCTLLAVQADGSEIKTIEGFSENGNMHPIQEAFKEMHGLQCGFCTPGMVIIASQLLERNPAPEDSEIREALEGNFCRCTGYHNIVKSIKEAAGKLN